MSAKIISFEQQREPERASTGIRSWSQMDLAHALAGE
jgi:hypothetical protein